MKDIAKNVKECKLGIATFINSLNFGAILQAYALGCYLRSLGYAIHYIDSDKEHVSIPPKSLAKKIFYYFVAKKRIRKKNDLFDNFKRDCFSIIRNPELLDVVVCGSDQVWNTDITDGFNPFFWGDCGKFNIAYAVSSGDSDIIEAQIDTVRKKIRNFVGISFRESDLSNVFYSHFGMICPTVCDPTFLLQKEDYCGIEEKECKATKPYLLIYQMNRDSSLYEIAHKIAKQKKLDVIEINNNLYDYKIHCHKCFYSCSVGKFLSLIHYSSYVITNSFHGTVFAIIYRKNFFTVKSKKRNSRIINLCHALNLDDRVLESRGKICLDDYESIDYEMVGKKINKFVVDSKNFLTQALGEIF